LRVQGVGVGLRVEGDGYTPSAEQASKRGEGGPALAGEQADQDRVRVQGLVVG